MPEQAATPLLTFGIAAFNQEAFIREAVAGAFSQTYSPLEIVLSDDCSRDRTFDIMSEMASTYRGPHRIILNRNPVQRSLGGHINRIVEISHGELIVGAAGDDISLPRRTEATYQAWERSGRRATSIHSDFIQIDEHGHVLPRISKQDALVEPNGSIEQQVAPLEYLRTLEPVVFGCTHVFSRQLFRVFGNLPDHIIHEDNAMAFRSILAGRICFVNEPLVRYRLHANNIFIRNGKPGSDLQAIQRQEDRFQRFFSTREAMYEGFLTDLEKARDLKLVTQTDFETIASEASRLRRRFTVQREFLAKGLLGKCRTFSKLKREGLEQAEISLLARRIIPRAILLRARLLRRSAALASF